MHFFHVIMKLHAKIKYFGQKLWHVYQQQSQKNMKNDHIIGNKKKSRTK